MWLIQGSDSSILSRLADAESRLQALEEQRVSGSAQAREGSESIGCPPDLHTASAHQMVHSWPRIRLCLTLANIDPLVYLARSDAEDPLLLQTDVCGAHVPRLTVRQATDALGNIYDFADDLPVELAYLFKYYGGLGRRHVLEELSTSYPIGDSLLDPSQLSIPQLLVISIALKSWSLAEVENTDQSAVWELSAIYMATCLNKQWTLLTATEDRIALSLAMASSLVYYWSRPFHALGLLQSIHETIKRLHIKQPNNP